MESVLDIGASFFSQFKKLTLTESDNSEFKDEENQPEELDNFDKVNLSLRNFYLKFLIQDGSL